MNQPYECSAEYWDGVSREQVVGKAGWPERYTRAQCLGVARRGLDMTPTRTQLRVLKTDLWTEGVHRTREVLHSMECLTFFWRPETSCPQVVQGYGIDVSAATCRRTRQHKEYPRIAQADIRALPFKPESFDMIYDLSTIDHVPLHDALATITGYWGCLAEGGVLILMFAHSEGVMWRASGDGYYTFPIWLLRDYLNAGFAVREEYAVHFLNIKPGVYLMQMAGRLGLQKALVKLVGHMEFTWLSRLLKKWAPMYVIIAKKQPDWAWRRMAGRPNETVERLLHDSAGAR